MEEDKAEAQEGQRAQQRTRVGLSAHREQDNSRLLVTDTKSQCRCQVGILLVLALHTLGITVLPRHPIPVPGAGPKAPNGLLDCHTNNSEGSGCLGGRALSQSSTSAGKAPGAATKLIKMEINTRM